MDTLIQKAWDLYQLTSRFSTETILTATVWLEEKHRRTPGEKLAMAIALHYLILALRRDAAVGAATAEEYYALAARWRARAWESNAGALAADTTQEKQGRTDEN